jgi:hypothetical protein
MNYNTPYDDLVEVTSVWRIFVPNERYAGKTKRLFDKLVQPERTSFYRASVARFDGYQIDLMGLTVDHGEASLSQSYPDW